MVYFRCTGEKKKLCEGGGYRGFRARWNRRPTREHRKARVLGGRNGPPLAQKKGFWGSGPSAPSPPKNSEPGRKKVGLHEIKKREPFVGEREKKGTNALEFPPKSSPFSLTNQGTEGKRPEFKGGGGEKPGPFSCGKEGSSKKKKNVKKGFVGRPVREGILKSTSPHKTQTKKEREKYIYFPPNKKGPGRKSKNCGPG